MKKYEGKLLAKGLNFGIIVSRFNEFISKRLLEGALESLKKHGAEDEQVAVAWVPGAFEIPLITDSLAKTGKYDALICLGAIIRGDTPHFEYVASEVAKGIAAVNIATGTPAVFGVITADSVEQAIERAGTKSGNKGWHAAEAAIEMANLVKAIGK